MKCQVGCPIRRFLDQSLFPAPQNLSQGITSFIASCCQGIHQTPFSRLIRSRERKAGLLRPGPIAGRPHRCARLPSDQKSYMSLRSGLPSWDPKQRLVYLTWNKATLEAGVLSDPLPRLTPHAGRAGWL